MSISNYPSGFAHGITIRELPLQVAHPGKVFWVNNSGVLPAGGVGASDGNDGTYLKPFLTLDYAKGRCTASRGDIIMIMPGHIEDVTATSIAIDVAGVAIVGLGEGDLRPLFKFGATTSNIIMSGANSSLKNVVLKSTIDSVVAGLTLTGAGLTVDIETRDTSAAIEFVSAIVTEATADNLHIKAVHRGFAAGDAMVRYIDVVGCRDAKIDVDFFGIASTAVVNMRTTACDNIQVIGRFYNESAALTKNVVNSTTSTWSVQGFDAKAGNNFAGSDDTSVAYTTTLVSSAFIPGLGYPIVKVSNLADGAGSDDLFVVTGRCLITHLSGEVTTIIGGAATLKLRDITNSIDLCAATTIDTDAVGTMYALPGLSAQILNGTGGTPVVGSVPNMTIPSSNAGQIIGDVQAPITIAQVLDAADTGAVTWQLYYLPLVAGASIVAAA